MENKIINNLSKLEEYLIEESNIEIIDLQKVQTFLSKIRNEVLAINGVGSSTMYKATFTFFKENPRGGRGSWCEELLPMQAKDETELNKKIKDYLDNDHNSYHTHIRLIDIRLM